MARQWMVKIGENEHGPLSSQHLRNIAKTGKLKPTDFVRSTESHDWSVASTMGGLFQVESSNELDVSQPNEVRDVSLPTVKSQLTFSEWYGTTSISRQPAAIQALKWICYGFIWIPVCYLDSVQGLPAWLQAFVTWYKTSPIAERGWLLQFCMWTMLGAFWIPVLYLHSIKLLPASLQAFVDWYNQKSIAKLPWPLQPLLWCFYGYIWIPLWYLCGARPNGFVPKLAWIALFAILGGLLLPAIKNARVAAKREANQANANSVAPKLDAEARLALLRTEGMTTIPADAVVLQNAVIDETFSPYQHGLMRLEDQLLVLGGPAFRTVQEVKHTPNNVIESRTVKKYWHTHKFGPVVKEDNDWSGKFESISRQRVRLHDGYVQTADDVNGDDLLQLDSYWSPVLKLSARSGDKWERLVSNARVSQLSLRSVFEWNGARYAVVDEESVTKIATGKLRSRTTTWYQQHIGEVRSETWFAENDAPLSWRHSELNVPIEEFSSTISQVAPADSNEEPYCTLAGSWKSSFYGGSIVLRLKERRPGYCSYYASGCLPSIGSNSTVGFTDEGGMIYDNKSIGKNQVILIGKHKLQDVNTIRFDGIETHGEGFGSRSEDVVDTWRRSR